MVAGPWHPDREQALKDTERLKDALSKGGIDRMENEAAGLHMDGCTLHEDALKVPDGFLGLEYQSKATFGNHVQHRWVCKLADFTDAGDGVISEAALTSPWRASIHRAEVDAKIIFHTYASRGLAMAQEQMSGLHAALVLPGL